MKKKYLLLTLLLASAVAASRGAGYPIRPRSAVSVRPRQYAAPADTGQFPLRYCTALPRLDIRQWDADYARYKRFLTPEIRRTQMGLSTSHSGVSYWYCRPAATAHAQLDTLTRIANPQLLEGHWRSLLLRTIAYTDSAVLTDKAIYRNVQLRPNPEADRGQNELLLADGKLTQLMAPAGAPLEKEGRKKYTLVSGRYLLLYGLAKASGGVCQVGLDSQGRLLLHICSVVERKVPGQYITYQTMLSQAIYERVP